MITTTAPPWPPYDIPSAAGLSKGETAAHKSKDSTNHYSYTDDHHSGAPVASHCCGHDTYSGTLYISWK